MSALVGLVATPPKGRPYSNPTQRPGNGNATHPPSLVRANFRTIIHESLSSWFRLRFCAFRSFDHIIEDSFEVFQSWGGDDDGVPASADIFRNAEETAARGFLERKDEGLAFDLDSVGVEGFLVQRRLGASFPRVTTGC